MKNALSVGITTRRIPLSPASIHALSNLDQYDVIAFTSKNARKFFTEVLKERRLTLPRHIRIIHVGPRNDLLKSPLKGMRILFPRSLRAPYDIVRRLRAKGVIVRPLPLYTAQGIPLSATQKGRLVQGKINSLYFKSPSGVTGLLQQFRREERKIVQRITAECIGPTTAEAARKAGFKKVLVKKVY
jgi:uroporphyrinogen-III synthase